MKIFNRAINFFIMRIKAIRVVPPIAYLIGTLIFSPGGCGVEQNPSAESPVVSKAEMAPEFIINATGNTITDMQYDLQEIRVRSGSKVKITLINKANTDALEHNLVVVRDGKEKEVVTEGLSFRNFDYYNAESPNVIKGTQITRPGEASSMEFIAPEPGTYRYICTYPEHWQRMQGKMVVD